MTAISRPRVLIVFGGRSSEHEISCSTAAGILTAIDRTKWDVIPLGITRDGQWVRVADDPSALAFRDGKGQSVTAGATRVALTPGEGRGTQLMVAGSFPGARSASGSSATVNSSGISDSDSSPSRAVRNSSSSPRSKRSSRSGLIGR